MFGPALTWFEAWNYGLVGLMAALLLFAMIFMWPKAMKREWDQTKLTCPDCGNSFSQVMKYGSSRWRCPDCGHNWNQPAPPPLLSREAT